MPYSAENRTSNLVPNPEYGGNVTEMVRNNGGGRILLTDESSLETSLDRLPERTPEAS